MENDAFLLAGWQSLTSHTFGAEAEKMLEENRDRFSELGEDEMRRATWAGLRDGTGEEEGGSMGRGLEKGDEKGQVL